jgi:large subunit ribosomal protein L9
LKVILLQEVEGLGHPGDVVQVSDGHARNLLIPNELALPGTKANLAQARKKIVHLEKREAGKRVEAEQAAKQMNQMTIQIRAKVGEGTRLFGTITHKEIQAVLEKQGIIVDRRKIELKEHIRMLGRYQVPVRLHKDLVGTFTLEVIPK